MARLARPGWPHLLFVCKVVFLAGIALACSGDDRHGADGTEMPTSGQTPLPATLDATLAVFVSGDTARTIDLVRKTEVPCVEGRPGPQCPEGASTGTPVPSFPVIGCELEFGTTDAFIADSIERALGSNQEVFAIATGESLEPGWLDRQQLAGGWIVITSTGREPGATGAGWLMTQDGKIVGLILGCDSPNQPAESLLGFLSVPEYLVPPPGE